jgi:hypothetical protein
MSNFGVCAVLLARGRARSKNSTKGDESADVESFLENH